MPSDQEESPIKLNLKTLKTDCIHAPQIILS